jgi:hypothetical protein
LLGTTNHRVSEPFGLVHDVVALKSVYDVLALIT